jgi:hypothetical protein
LGVSILGCVYVHRSIAAFAVAPFNIVDRLEARHSRVSQWPGLTASPGVMPGHAGAVRIVQFLPELRGTGRDEAQKQFK